MMSHMRPQAQRAAISRCIFTLACVGALLIGVGSQPLTAGRDQFNNRVIEVKPNGDIIWQFGIGPTDFSENSILGTNDAQRVGKFTLMGETGIPAGVDPNAPNGAADNRVLLADRNGKIHWHYS
jgi:hypothetical protein